MKNINIRKLMSIAKKLNSKGKKWHFHILAPTCIFNPQKDKYAFILENVKDKHIFVSYSRKRYLKHGKELVKLIYGPSIINNRYNKTRTTNRKIKTILGRANRLNELDIEWEHHLLFPRCIFNKYKGKWCIVFEDPESNKIIECVYKHEPVVDLRAIEILYYQQKK